MAEEQIEATLPKKLQAVFQGPPVPGSLVDPEKLFSQLWLSEENFYPWIDLLVTGFSDSWTRVMVTVSGRPPVSFWDTWQPKEFGPFKPLGADTRLWKKQGQ